MAEIKWEPLEKPHMTVQVAPAPEPRLVFPGPQEWLKKGTHVEVSLSIRLYVPPGVEVGTADFDKLYSKLCDVVEESGRG